jgi:hypothetical protein
MEEVKFTDKFGHKRIGIKLFCKVCGIEYISRRDKIQRACSQKCGIIEKNKNKIIIKNCVVCNKEIRKSLSKLKNSKHGFYFCSRKCKDIGQSTIKEIQPPHYGTADRTKYYRKNFIKNNDLICSRCDYKEFDCSVQIHHIDKNRKNDNPNNLIALCANCHMALHSNRWKL